jgi:epoxyqueuosine reductase QueG
MRLPEQTIKHLACDLGADLCGIAPVERFQDAPAGFRPNDIFAQAKSVVALAKRFPEGPFHSRSPILYTATGDVILQEVTRITVLLCAAIEAETGAQAVPVPSEPYEYWDAENREGKGLLSLKHAAWLAGLGVITANSLLTNDRYGNRLCLGAALLDIELDGDPIAAYRFDCEPCHLCMDSCPAHAIRDRTVNQKLCRGNSEGKTVKGHSLYVCNACRRVCPRGAGGRRVSSDC